MDRKRTGRVRRAFAWAFAMAFLFAAGGAAQTTDKAAPQPPAKAGAKKPPAKPAAKKPAAKKPAAKKPAAKKPVAKKPAAKKPAARKPAAKKPAPKRPPKAPAKKSPEKAPEKSEDEGLQGPTLDLFKAVELNDMDRVRASLDAGADLKAENKDGLTAADLAVDRGHFIIAHYLLSRRLLGETAPIALAPGKAEEAAKMAAAEQKKPEPEAKPAAPEPPAKLAEKPPAKPEPAPKAKAPPKAADRKKPQAPTPAKPPPKMADKPKPKAPTPAKPPDKAAAPEKTVETAEPSEAAPDVGTVAEVPAAEAAGTGLELLLPPADKPLADQGVADFFTALVEMIMPGGETPAVVARKEESEPEPGPPTLEPDEIVVEITGDEKAPEPIEETPIQIVEGPSGPETIIADPAIELETVTVEPEDIAEAEKSLVDRMAGLFTTDDNAGKAPGKPGAAPPPGAGLEEDDLAQYDLPVPPTRPVIQRKFSPRMLDRLADLLEGGDEETFKAWLPEMQIMTVEKSETPAPAEKEPQVAAAPAAPAEPPAPDKAPRQPVTEAPLDAAGKPGDQAAPAEPPKAAEPAPPAAKPVDGDGPGLIQGVLDRLANVMTPDFGNRERSEKLALEPGEKLAGADKRAWEASDGAEKEPPAHWPITEVKTAEAPKFGARPRGGPMIETSLRGVTLSLGESVSLENSYPPLGTGVDPHNQCLKKNRGTTLFCLETVDWPESLRADFLVPTILYTGHKAIARYDQGVASRFHALFPSQAFKKVAKYFTDRFGPPTAAWNRSIAPFAKPRQDNPTMAWRSEDPETAVITVLEIRQYDDTRGGFPDTSRGAVMLYLANSPPIFPQVSSHELMRISRSRMAPPVPAAAEGAPGAPGAAPGAAPPDAAPGPDAPDAAGADPGAAKSPAEMTSEELQAERRKRKAAEKAKQEAEEGGAVPAKVEEEGFELPPDPKGR